MPKSLCFSCEWTQDKGLQNNRMFVNVIIVFLLINFVVSNFALLYATLRVSLGEDEEVHKAGHKDCFEKYWVCEISQVPKLITLLCHKDALNRLHKSKHLIF